MINHVQENAEIAAKKRRKEKSLQNAGFESIN